MLTNQAKETPAGLFLRPPGGHEKLAAQVTPDSQASLARPTFRAHQAVAIFGPRLFGSVIFLRPYRACSFGMRSWIIGSWSWVSVDVALHGLSLGFEDLGWGMGCGSMHPVSN